MFFPILLLFTILGHLLHPGKHTAIFQKQLTFTFSQVMFVQCHENLHTTEQYNRW